MARNLTGETWAVVHADELRPKQWGPGAPTDQWWPLIEARLAKFSALRSPFLQAVERGKAPRDALDAFVRDLVVLSKEIPLHESRIAAALEHHGENSVVIMSYPTALAMGYAGYPYMPDLAEEFALAWGIGKTELRDHELGPWPKAYLNALYNLGRQVEMGVAATLVDAEWNELATRLRRAFIRHYGVPERSMELFEALAALDGPRKQKRPLILHDIARTAYHQAKVIGAVKRISSLWRRMWDAWLEPDKAGLTFPLGDK